MKKDKILQFIFMLGPKKLFWDIAEGDCVCIENLAIRE